MAPTARRCSPGTASRSTTSSSAPSTPSTPASRCSSPRPTGLGQDRRGRVRRGPGLAAGRRAFYTAPIKALSNQKFHDLAAVHGAEQVGLLTGDNAINGDAPIVVMTTEVLRNMIYGRSAALDRLGVVVLDEVHYLQDTYRGPVWEEVIIHLPADGAAGLPVGDGVERRGAGRLDLHRPGADGGGHRGAAAGHAAEPLPDRRQDLGAPAPAADPRRRPAQPRGGPARRRGGAGLAGRRWPPPGPAQALHARGGWRSVERLEHEGMLPAIYFIFSRNACDDAAQTCLDAGLRLTTGPERDRIREIVDEHLGGIDDRDLAVLGYGKFLAGLEHGIAAHHAGMVPPFKEAVEHCFVEGSGEGRVRHRDAGRRHQHAGAVGGDREAHEVHRRAPHVPHARATTRSSPAGPAGGASTTSATPSCCGARSCPFDQVAALASSRSFHLRSAFRPTYNMAANLVRSYTAERAHHLLNLSFAQYQADREVVRLEARLERRQARAGRAASGGRQPLRRHRRVPAPHLAGRAPARDRTPRDVEAALGRLRPGDVIVLSPGPPP